MIKRGQLENIILTAGDLIRRLNQIGYSLWEGGVGGQLIPRPFMGGETTGFHTAPPIGSHILVLHEQGMPQAMVSTTGTPEAMPVLHPTESAIYGPDGHILSRFYADGTAAVYKDNESAPTVSITIDSSGNIIFNTPAKVIFNAGAGIWSGSTQITVP